MLQRNEVGTVAFNGYIRIGVVPSVDLVRIGSPGDYVIRDKSTGAELMSGSNGNVDVTLESVLVTR